MLERSDRLLRGSRDERIADMLALETAEWSLDAVLDLHRGLLDHAEEVRLAAIEALKAIAQRSPEQLTLTPAIFLAHHMFSFTAASGAAVRIFRFLVELDTPESIRLAMEALEHPSRNDDFKAFVETVVRAKKLDLLRQLRQILQARGARTWANAARRGALAGTGAARHFQPSIQQPILIQDSTARISGPA